jgi:exodeoxyribonuclease VII small subunit
MTQSSDANTNTPQDAPPDFEQALAQLEELVARMEGGEQSLDTALADFERGIALVRTCRDGLERAEQRVQILLGDKTGANDGNGGGLRDLDPDGDFQ